VEGVEVVRFPYFVPSWQEPLAYRSEGLVNALRADPAARLQVPFFLAAFAWHALVESRDVDLLHAFWTPVGAMALPAKLLRGRPMILSPLGSDLRHLPSVFNRIVIRLADSVVAAGGPTTEVHDRLVAITSKVLHPIFLPIDEPQLDRGDGDELRRELRIKDERVITFIGRLCETKDPVTFVRAASLLLKRRSAIRFLVVGDGPLLPKLMDLSQALGLRGEITFTGARRDIGSILKASDAFAALSPESNCWSTTIAEAMYLKVPCVLADTWLVPPHDPDALAGALDRILGDRDLACRLARGGEALLRAHRREDALILDDTAVMYEAVLRERGRARLSPAR